MTTKVTVDAHAGWPVDVTPMRGGVAVSQTERVPANETRDFYVHSTQDLHIREVQPDGSMMILSESASDRTLQFFAYEHLPAHLQAVSRPFGELAQHIVRSLPANAERSAGLRKLLEAKDCAVRALLYKDS